MASMPSFEDLNKASRIQSPDDPGVVEVIYVDYVVADTV